MALLLQATPALWNRTETISVDGHTYRLHFTSGSRETGTWDPAYFDSLRTTRQLRAKIRILARRTNGWGGVLVGVHKPADPGKYFLPPRGLAVPVTAAVDFNPVGTKTGTVRDATLALYNPNKRETIQTACVQRPLAADVSAAYGSLSRCGAMTKIMKQNNA